ncbi:MAG: F-type H+-transporting ATPase subunit epsilon [Candidatus Marinamargulisbacteria bacterium]|jgi:F-type H+-transporting ATPase subunit epsilon
MADQDTFKIKIVTPKGSSFEQLCAYAKLPGVTGEIGVLPNHSPLVAQLKSGKIRVEHDDEIQRFFVPEGFAHVTQTEVLILVPFAEEKSTIDVSRANESKRRAIDRLSDYAPEIDRERARKALMRAESRLYIAIGEIAKA